MAGQGKLQSNLVKKATPTAKKAATHKITKRLSRASSTSGRPKSSKHPAVQLKKPSPKRSAATRQPPPPVPNIRKMMIPRPDILHRYLRHAEINQYLEYIERRYPAFVKLHMLGHSWEHRSLKCIEINWMASSNKANWSKLPKFDGWRARSAPGRTHTPQATAEGVLMAASKAVAVARARHGVLSSQGTSVNRLGVMVPEGAKDSNETPVKSRRNVVFIEGGTHAREWLTITVALHCIYQLTEKNVRNRDILEKLRFFIVPLSNPDGYEYTLSKNPRWRKNRRPHGKTVGTDCNRNYDYFWEMGSANSGRCTYKGEAPFSEPETCALRNILKKLAPQLLFFLSLHSYQQSIMYPWGCTMSLPAEWEKLELMASTGSNAIKTYSGRTYRTGAIARLQNHTIPGSIVDYAYGTIGVPLALVMELPSREYGFQPPSERISPLGHESWYGIAAMCDCAHTLSSIVKPTDSSLKAKSKKLPLGDVAQKRMQMASLYECTFPRASFMTISSIASEEFKPSQPLSS